MVDSFGDAVRQLRQDRGWSLGQFARRVRWSASAISMVETGDRPPTIEFATACDEVFASSPILTTLWALGREETDMRRRALLGGLSAALAVDALSAYTALAEVIRRELLEASGMVEDWDEMITGYRRLLVSRPDQAFGDQLLASMLSARQQLAARSTTDILRASANLSLLYGLWMGNLGNTATGMNFYRTAANLAELSGDRETHVYVLARTAAGGPFQGLSRSHTERAITKALDLAGDRPYVGALVAHGAVAQLAALTGDVQRGRTAVGRMWRLSDQLPEDCDAPGPQARTASLAAYLEGRQGELHQAQKAWWRAESLLQDLPEWQAEAKLYYALAYVRHGKVREGLGIAVQAARSLKYSVRAIRLAADDVLTALPEGYRDDLSEELRQHGTTGPKPWELIAA